MRLTRTCTNGNGALPFETVSFATKGQHKRKTKINLYLCTHQFGCEWCVCVHAMWKWWLRAVQIKNCGDNHNKSLQYTNWNHWNENKSKYRNFGSPNDTATTHVNCIDSIINNDQYFVDCKRQQQNTGTKKKHTYSTREGERERVNGGMCVWER